jgi:hypothetical protein
VTAECFVFKAAVKNVPEWFTFLMTFYWTVVRIQVEKINLKNHNGQQGLQFLAF